MHTNGIAACIARDTERDRSKAMGVSTRARDLHTVLTRDAHTHTHPTHPTNPAVHQHSSTDSQPCGIVRNSFAITSAHDEPERHRHHAPLDCLTAQIHVYLPGRCCQHRLPHPDHSTRTHRALEANRRRRSQQRPYTQRGREQQAHKRHRSMHCKRQRDRSKALGCQHSSKRLTFCPHQRRTHTPIPPVQQHNSQPASHVAVSDHM